MTSNSIVLNESREDILLFRAGVSLCALPLEVVLETMRPLPLQAVGHNPHLKICLSVIRGRLCPVIDLARYFEHSAVSTRWLLVSVSPDRNVALAVTSVEGVFQVPSETLVEKPLLFEGVSAELTQAIGRLDGELFSLLQTGSLLSESDWESLQSL